MFPHGLVRILAGSLAWLSASGCEHLQSGDVEEVSGLAALAVGIAGGDDRLVSAGRDLLKLGAARKQLAAKARSSPDAAPAPLAPPPTAPSVAPPPRAPARPVPAGASGTVERPGGPHGPGTPPAREEQATAAARSGGKPESRGGPPFLTPEDIYGLPSP